MLKASTSSRKHSLRQRFLHGFIAGCTLLCAANILAQEVPQSSLSLTLELINDSIDQSLNGGAIKAIWEADLDAAGYEASVYFNSPDESAFELIRTETVLQTAATTLSETFTGLNTSQNAQQKP